MFEDEIHELLRVKGRTLFHRESQVLEFKEQFNLAGLADYFRDFAGFANNRGGYLIFGVKDAPRILCGLSDHSREQFEKIDPERIEGFLLEYFAPKIDYEQYGVIKGDMFFGVFKIYESENKPVIAKKSDPKCEHITNADIYYRYGGRTQRILFAELESIINRRIEKTNAQWVHLMEKIGKVGPSNAAILDTEEGLITRDPDNVLLIDEDLVEKIKFIKEGAFVENKGASTLRLVGDVVPVTQLEINKKVKESTLKQYPLSANEVASKVCARVKNVSQQDVWAAIRENEIKYNTDYSVFNFRNKKQEDKYIESGEVPTATPSIYNDQSVEFLVKVLSESM